MEAQVLPRVAHDADPVDGRVEVEPERIAAQRGGKRPGADRGRGTRRGIDGVDAAGAAEPEQLAGGGTDIDPEECFASAESGDGHVVGDGARIGRRESNEPIRRRQPVDRLCDDRRCDVERWSL